MRTWRAPTPTLPASRATPWDAEVGTLTSVVHQCPDAEVGTDQMGRQVVQDLAQQAGTGYQGRRVKRGKVVFRFKGNRAKTVHGLYGPVTVERAYYYASGSGETCSAAG